ncbi:ferritin-like domain-containing protein [Kribbella sp. CA-293567]|uniref:ferritin-like domain-containing protein n=1 Tax=Kribbella sp. CA-293567 TaxID=3002436 RepID=UPI0022DD1C0C|nr:ferritin-like domain-containing protein [Kribbella sp. CA-293567]WBQ03869.1 ferritin-like domain-containing protein [Kribbella sp. CA-293567]
MTDTTADLIHGNASAVPAGVALGALNNGFALTSAKDFKNDIEVLNYALALEYLEAEFYRQGNAANLVKGKEKQYLMQIGADEASHVATLTATIQKLGGTPIGAPAVDFGGAFETRKSYLTTAHIFENKGVGAYLGAAGFVKDKMILQAAAGIFGVEARHAAVVGNLLGLEAEGGVYLGAFEKGLAKADVLTAVAPFLVDPNKVVAAITH